jgi:GTP-binding protein LepA
MVFAGLYPIDGDDFPTLREALEKLQLNDAALHLRAGDPLERLASVSVLASSDYCIMEIVRERLEREFNLDLISTAPNVVYRVEMEDGRELHRDEPERVSRRKNRQGL